MTRIAIPGDIQDQVLLLSRRRCCVCFGLYGDAETKRGQIAHLDQNNQNYELSNLAWLCFDHHDEYDSKTKQSKGLRETELKQYRASLYSAINAALAQAEQKFLHLFGDETEQTQWFEQLQASALAQTAAVQCLGMRRPVPFSEIYQPMRVIIAPNDDENSGNESYAWNDRTSRSILRGRAFNETSISLEEFLRRDEDAIIVSGPGWGKTTFLHHVFRTTIQLPDVLPVLITLRRPKGVDDLERYVNACTHIQKTQRRAYTLLLVDGYDEVTNEQRARVSDALIRYQGLRTGKFYLTCREYYALPQLNAPEVRLESFNREDQIAFVKVFLTRFASIKLDAEEVVKQLEERGFEEFLKHPLMLTLACIVRTSATSAQPRSALRLLDRALDVLCFQWDEQRNIDRQSTTRLEGADRQDILKHIALAARSPFVPGARAEEITRAQLNLMGMDRVDPRQVLLEIARFFGILVPAEDGYEFVHRTIHDFLAAQLWVESGLFANVKNYEWNARTAYAACRMSDATHVLTEALAAPDGLPTVTEIIGNSAKFDYKTIAEALIKYFSTGDRVLSYQRRTHDETDRKYSPRIVGQLANGDFIRLANSRFLKFIFEYCCDKNSAVADLMVAYAAVELYDRWLKLEHTTYEKARAVYKTEMFAFVVPGAKQTQLQFLNPILQNRMKEYKAQGDADPS